NLSTGQVSRLSHPVGIWPDGDDEALPDMPGELLAASLRRTSATPPQAIWPFSIFRIEPPLEWSSIACPVVCGVFASLSTSFMSISVSAFAAKIRTPCLFGVRVHILQLAANERSCTGVHTLQVTANEDS